MGATETETEIETVIEIGIETVGETTIVTMSFHRMLGTRHAEAPAAVALDSRALVVLKRNIGKKAGRHIMTGNGMMKNAPPRRRMTVTDIVMTIRVVVEDGRKFAEVVD